MRLLIAEDELWLRKRLVSTIDWSSYGISEVYEAEDGGEALEIALKEKPDIVITDIRMPELSGIDLMKKLNENSIFSKMIVVSGYDDFEYAQGALRMGAINYLLKPVDEEELLDSVKRCVEELKKEKNKETVFDKQSAASEMLMEHIYEDLIFETSEKRTEELLQKLSRKEIGFPFQSAAVVNMQVREHTFFVNDKVKSDMWSVYQWLRRNLQEDCYECQYLYMRGSQIVLLLFGDDLEAKFMERVENWVQLILEALQKELNISLFMAAGDVTDDFSGIHRSYEMAQKKIKEKRAEEKKILALRNQETEQELNTRFDDVYGEYDFKLLIKEIRNGDSEKAQTELQAMEQEVDAICIYPVSPTGSLAGLENAAKQGIDIYSVDLSMESKWLTGYCEANQYNIGQMVGKECAEYIRENFPDRKPKTAIIQFSALLPDTSKSRTRGFLSMTQSLIDVVQDVDAWDASTSTPIVKEVLDANPDLDMIFCANEGGTVGAVMAVQNAGLKIPVFGIDITEQLVNMMLDDDNILQALGGQDPVQLGERSMENLCRYLMGKDYESEIVIPGILLSRSRPGEARDYIETMRQILEQDKK